MIIQREFLALYKLRDGDNYDLWCIFTRTMLKVEPIDIEDAKDENFICVWGDINDFPDVWDGSFDD